MILMWTNAAGELETLTFDATLREVLNGTATVTQQPLDTGASSADHVITSPIRASFEVFVSDSPSSEPTSQMSGVRGRMQSTDLDGGKMRRLKSGASGLGKVAADYEQEGVKATANVLQFDGPFARRERVWEVLDRLRRERTLLIADCELVQLEDCVIVSVSAPLDDKSGDGVSFPIELQQITFAESQTAEVPVPEEPRAIDPTDGGAITPEPVGEESILHSLTLGGS